MWRSLTFAICSLQIVLSVLAASHYTVIGPGVIHPEHKYTVAVAVHDTTEPCQLKVGITSGSYKEHKIVPLNVADEVKLVDFDVPALEKDDFNLTAEGISGITFYNTTKLIYQNFEPHVLIQTDKGAYKPGDVVQFRAIFLDENFRPYNVKPSTYIWFEDSKRNRIKEFKNLQVVNGVYTGKFEISEYAVLGGWRIIVDTFDEGKSRYHGKTTAYFNVEKYVLPKYVVSAEATKDVSVLDGDMQVIVRANYTYGKPVNGKTRLIMEVGSYYAQNPGSIPLTIKSADMINGKSKFDFNVKEYDGKIPKKYASYARILATVEEDFTGVLINATTSSTLYPYRYKFNCENWASCSTYHADKEFEVVYKILHVDNSKVEDTKTVVRLIYTENIDESYDRKYKREKGETVAEVTLPEKMLSYVFESHLNASSMVTFKVTLPDLPDIEGYNHHFKTEVEFAEQKDEMYGIHPYRKPKELAPTQKFEEPKDYFKIHTKYEKDKYQFKDGEQAVFVLNSSVPFSYFIYTIVGRGNVLKGERVELPQPAKVFELKFLPTVLMAPHAQLYIYYVENGDYYYAEAHFSVEYKFQNKINISVPEQVKVGENVPVQISTAPNSFVGLLGVDQSVLLHKRNNDVNENNLRWKASSFRTYTPPQGGYSNYPGQTSGVVTLTNANYFYNWTKPSWDDYSILREDGVYQMESYASPAVAMSSEHSYVRIGGASSPSNPTIRKNFAETWIFDNIENTEAENTTWFAKIPDTITSWVITGFSLNAEKGFASTKDKSYVKTFQPFFVSIRLPYSVKRGEVISIPALVFNYLENDLDVEVILENTDNEYEFTEVTNEVFDLPSRSKTVRVPANSAKGVSFMIRPKIIGNILLKLKAISPLAGDAIHKTLKVVPEGITEYANRAYFVNLGDFGVFEDTFKLELPEEIVPDSDHVEFSVVGDILGPLFDNLNSLVRMPTGCGEQTMSTFVPNYLALLYLKNINSLKPETETRIKNNLESGYQNMLSFRHEDGSFSSFGPGMTYDNKPRNGSTWLTAYVIRFLQEARSYLNLDSKVIHDGLNYLRQRQASNGSFTEAGEYFFRSQSNEVSLTASVLLAFLANDIPALYSQQTNDGLKFISENIETTKDLRAKALAVFTLKKAKHELASKHLADIKALAKSDLDRMWWTSEEENVKKSPYFRTSYWWRWPRGEEVEVTSYVLLSLLDEENETVESVLPIVKWLIAQRNSYGGFSSTQDTVVGLQALIKFTEKSAYEPAEMHLDFTTEGKRRTKSGAFNVSTNNAILMQSHELPEKTNAIHFQARGMGAALVQVSYQYNIFEKEKSPSFTLNTIIDTNTPPHKLEMDVCVDYVGTGSESNMALLEVSLPSGFVAEEETFEELRKVDRVRHIELKKSGTNIVVYFESVRKDDVKCLRIEAFRSFAVALQKPTPIVVYDYYDTTKKATLNYEVASKLCEICDREEEKCQEICG